VRGAAAHLPELQASCALARLTPDGIQHKGDFVDATHDLVRASGSRRGTIGHPVLLIEDLD
jgi:hypothetical protein